MTVTRLRQSHYTALGIPLSVTASICWASSAVLGKPAVQAGLHPGQFVCARTVIAAVVLFAGVTLFRPSLLRVPRSGWPLLIVYGLLVMALMPLLYLVAASRVPVGVAILIVSASPVLVALWVRFVRRNRLPRPMWGGIALVMTGLTLVSQVWHGLDVDALGLLAAVSAALCAAVYFLVGEHLVHDLPPLTVITWGMVVGALVMCGVSAPWTLSSATLTAEAVLGPWGPPVWALLVSGALVVGVLGYLLGVSSLQYLPVTVASVLALADPIVATALAWVLLGEQLTVTQMSGAVVLLAGAVVVQWYSPGKQPFEPLPPLGETTPGLATPTRPDAGQFIPVAGSDTGGDHTDAGNESTSPET